VQPQEVWQQLNSPIRNSKTSPTTRNNQSRICSHPTCSYLKNFQTQQSKKDSPIDPTLLPEMTLGSRSCWNSAFTTPCTHIIIVIQRLAS